jgi:DNA-binding transcriptional LysR family regulator
LTWVGTVARPAQQRSGVLRVTASETFAYAMLPGLRANSLVHQLRAVASGLGIALLPCYLADADPGSAPDFRRSA